ncbi:hypothetical protein ACIP9H_04480 [Streptomyces sp. NPDC088732]|uniref:hypothetical protein n=1 Tax=Streptomyces sp. NPDC088732 TaxID=3365879 RepID=UPI0038104012
MVRKAVRITTDGVTGRTGFRRHRVRPVLAPRGRGGPGDGGTPRPERALAGRPGPEPAQVPIGRAPVLAGPAAGGCIAVRATGVRGEHPAAPRPAAPPRPAHAATSTGVRHRVVREDGLRNCRTRHRCRAPEPARQPDARGFRPQGELFPRQVLPGGSSPRDLPAGARGAQPAELAQLAEPTELAPPAEPALGSPTAGRRPDVPELTL